MYESKEATSPELRARERTSPGVPAIRMIAAERLSLNVGEGSGEFARMHRGSKLAARSSRFEARSYLLEFEAIFLTMASTNLRSLSFRLVA